MLSISCLCLQRVICVSNKLSVSPMSYLCLQWDIYVSSELSVSPVSYLYIQWAICVPSELPIILWAGHVPNELPVYCLHWAIVVLNEQAIWVTSLILRSVHLWKCEQKSCNSNPPPPIKYILSPTRHCKCLFVYYAYTYGVTINLWGKTKINVLYLVLKPSSQQTSIPSILNVTEAQLRKKPLL